MHYLNLLILLLCLGLSSCAKKINNKASLPFNNANNSQLPEVKTAKPIAKATETKPSETKTETKTKTSSEEESDDDFKLINGSCINEENSKRLITEVNKIIAKDAIPVENLIDGKSQADMEDLKKLLSNYNLILKTVNEKCPQIDLESIKYIRKTLSLDLDYLGFEVVDAKHTFCSPCYDKKEKTYLIGIK